MNYKNLTICKANKVIEASYKLSLNEQRVILACIGQVNSIEELLKTDKFELTAKDFSKLYDITEDKAYQTLKDIADQLFERYVIIDNPDPEIPTLKYTKTRWVSSIDYAPDMGKIVLYFATRMLPYLGQLKGSFTKYKLEHIGKMTCIYAIRLYELLVQWQKTGIREVEIDWLKRQFEIEETYNNMNDFKKRVLDPAVKDINEHSNLKVSWTQRKTGRRVTHLTFIFDEKDKPEPKPKEKYVLGVKESEIKKHARIGESWEQAATRIKAEKKAAKEKNLSTKNVNNQ